MMKTEMYGPRQLLLLPLVLIATSVVPAAANGQLLVITRQVIVDDQDRNGLSDFVAHKRQLGFTVMVRTLAQIRQRYGGSAQEAMRQEIRTAYRNGVRYTLLIGNADRFSGLLGNPPRPAVDHGMVPMAYCRTTENNGGSSTDFYYSDFSSNWNRDGDDRLGETWQEVAQPRMAVGRIQPVGGYVPDVLEENGSTLLAVSATEKLRSVLHKMIRYERELRPTWRFTGLAMGSWMYGTARGNAARTLDKTIQVLRGVDARVRFDRLYQDGTDFGLVDRWFNGVDSPSDPEATADLTPGKSGSGYGAWVRGRYGMVMWRAHGAHFHSQIGGGSRDESTQEGKFVDRRWVLRERPLPDAYPAIVMSASCNNYGTGSGAPNDHDKQRSRWGSLSPSLLYRGAIGVLSATYVTLGETSAPADPAMGRSAWYQRYFLRRVLEGQTFGMALLEARAEVVRSYGNSSDLGRLKDMFRINGLFDPTMRLPGAVSRLADDALEGAGNDEQAAATALPLARHRHGWRTEVAAGVAKNPDWYQVTIPRPYTLAVSLRIARELTLGEVDVVVLDASGQPVAGTLARGAEAVVWTGRASRTTGLYVAVVPRRHAINYGLDLTLLRVR